MTIVAVLAVPALVAIAAEQSSCYCVSFCCYYSDALCSDHAPDDGVH